MAGTVATKKASTAAQPDMYLGLLYPMEEFKVFGMSSLAYTHASSFGYITNTKIKLILIIDDTNTEIKESELRAVRIDDSILALLTCDIEAVQELSQRLH